eukprot:1701305-Amphidinium_carterae.2
MLKTTAGAAVWGGKTLSYDRSPPLWCKTLHDTTCRKSNLRLPFGSSITNSSVAEPGLTTEGGAPYCTIMRALACFHQSRGYRALALGEL